MIAVVKSWAIRYLICSLTNVGFWGNGILLGRRANYPNIRPRLQINCTPLVATDVWWFALQANIMKQYFKPSFIFSRFYWCPAVHVLHFPVYCACLKGPGTRDSSSPLLKKDLKKSRNSTINTQEISVRNTQHLSTTPRIRGRAPFRGLHRKRPSSVKFFDSALLFEYYP